MDSIVLRELPSVEDADAVRTSLSVSDALLCVLLFSLCVYIYISKRIG